MLNLHIYPSTITTESRIEREVATISDLALFDEIEVAGVADPRLPTIQRLNDTSLIRRFAREAGGHGFIKRTAKSLNFGRQVFAHYSDQPLGVINCHSVAALPISIALKRVSGAALVYDTHELETEVSASRGPRRPIYKFLERTGMHYVDHVFTVTKSIEDWYRRTYGIANIDTIYNYPSAQQTHAGQRGDKAYFRETFGIPSSSKIYLYQGILGPGRGLELAYNAFASERLTDAAFVLLGYGPWEAEVRRWAAEVANIHFHPKVSPSELSQLTAQADVGLALTVGSTSLSYLYSAPNKLFQYWRAGLPVVATSLPEHIRFMKKYPAGALTNEETTDSLLQALHELEGIPRDAIDGALKAANSDLQWEHYGSLFHTRYSAFAELSMTRNNKC